MIKRFEKIKLNKITQRITKGTTPTTLGMSFADSGVNFIKAESLNGDTNLDTKGFAFISENTHKLLGRSILEIDDVLITIAGANIGKCGFVREQHVPANTNQAVAIIRIDKQKAIPRYIYYYFKQPRMFAFIQSLNAQAAQPNINLTSLGELTLYLPEIAIEQKIAAILSSYDDLIENNLKRIKLMEEMAKITYEEWFVRLKFPGHEITAMDSETGLPAEWKRILLEQACDVSGGGTPSTEIDEYWNGGDISWFSPTDLSKNNSLVLLDSSQKITQKGLQKSSAKLMQPNSFMMTSRATIGLFGLIDKPFCTNQGFINVTPKSNFHKHFLLFNFKLRVPEFLNYASGATFLEISKSKFKKLKIDWPTSELLEKWDEVSTPIIQELTNLSKQNQLLKEARDILLPRLMTGMIDVEQLVLPEPFSNSPSSPAQEPQAV